MILRIAENELERDFYGMLADRFGVEWHIMAGEEA